MANRTFHITPEGGSWSIKPEDEGTTRNFPNKIAAVSAARRMAQRAGISELVVYRKDGRIESREIMDLEERESRYGDRSDKHIEDQGAMFPEGRSQDLTSSSGDAGAYPDSPLGLADVEWEMRRPLDRSGLHSGILEDLTAKTGESPKEIIRKALALYKASLEAVERGKAVGTASDPSHLELEFVGF